MSGDAKVDGHTSQSAIKLLIFKGRFNLLYQSKT